MATVVMGGFDPSGGAGVSADLQVLRDLGEPPLAVITAVTAQNQSGVQGFDATKPAILEAQIASILEEQPINAFKLGMLGDEASARIILSFMKRHPDIPWIVDPIVSSSSGGSLMPAEVGQILKSEILPRSTLITPNLSEIQSLFGEEVQTEEDLVALAIRLSEGSPTSYLLKGGHLKGLPVDVLGEHGHAEMFRGTTRYPDARGTGCRLATSIAVHLGRGLTLRQSVRQGRDYVQRYLSEQDLRT